jgi:hypothetical protein
LRLLSPYNKNYTISYVSAPLAITPATLTITATSETFTYGQPGSYDPDGCGYPSRHLGYTVTGLAWGQPQALVLFGQPSETTTAPVRPGVGVYPITISQGNLMLDPLLAKNYTIVYVNGSITVTPAVLNVVANSYSRKVNTANPAFGYTITGFVYSDSAATALTGAASCCSTTATTSSAAGIYPIAISQGTLTAKNGNYTLNFVNGALYVWSSSDRNDPHNNGRGGFCTNSDYDRGHWPDTRSYPYYWGGGAGPVVLNWN